LGDTDGCTESLTNKTRPQVGCIPVSMASPSSLLSSPPTTRRFQLASQASGRSNAHFKVMDQAIDELTSRLAPIYRAGICAGAGQGWVCWASLHWHSHIHPSTHTHTHTHTHSLSGGRDEVDGGEWGHVVSMRARHEAVSSTPRPERASESDNDTLCGGTSSRLGHWRRQTRDMDDPAPITNTL